MLRQYLHKRKLARLSQKVAHVCMTCDWFKMTILSDGETGNRMCKYPRSFKREDWPNHICRCWKIAEDIETRRTDIWGIVT